MRLKPLDNWPRVLTLDQTWLMSLNVYVRSQVSRNDTAFSITVLEGVTLWAFIFCR